MLIFLIVTAVVFTAVACNGKDDVKNISLSYDEETGVIKWYSKNADKYLLQIFELDNPEPIISLEFSSASDTSMNCTQKAGKYKILLTVYRDNEVIASKEIDINIKEELSDGNQSNDNNSSSNNEPESDRFVPAKILKKTYYYKKDSNSDFTISLVNNSRVVNVDAFELLNRSMWTYDVFGKTLTLHRSYLQKFSVGARLDVKIEYADNQSSEINVQIVNTLPLDVIGGEDGVIEVDTSAMALNYRIALGYDGKTLDEGASKIVKQVCIDGKKRATTDYITESSKAALSLYYAKVLNSLTSGLHYLEIYTIYGRSEVWLNVSNGRKNFPYNVRIDYDSSYPNIYVKWDIYREDAEYFIVEIGNNSYNSKDDPSLFDGNCFNASGKIAYGDSVVVKAVFDSKAQYSDISKATLDVNIFSYTISSYLSYDKSFEFLGNRYNYYIDSFDEFFDMMYYALLFYDELPLSDNSAYEKSITFYPNGKAITNVDSSFKQVVNRLNEAVKATHLTEKLGDSGAYRIHLKVQSSFVPDTERDETGYPVYENSFQDTHFSATGRATDFEDFAINKAEKNASVRLSEELYLAVERGICPVPVAGSSAYAVYEKAKQVLRQIIDDSMNDYQKVHAIYDWLGRSVIYDWDINTKMKGISPSNDAYNKFYKYRQFYLEGVFIDGVAVCNGIAKAMSLMCGIEGISCYKIKGESRGSAHAWTKVGIDGNWYVVDATWANRTFSNNITQTKREILAHHTIFMSETSSGNSYNGAHRETYTGEYSDKYAGEDYNVFANTFFEYNSNLYDYVIDSVEELKVLIDYYKGKCGAQQFITIDVSCDLATLKTYLISIEESNYNIEASDYNGAMSGVSSVIITKR